MCGIGALWVRGVMCCEVMVYEREVRVTKLMERAARGTGKRKEDR